MIVQSPQNSRQDPNLERIFLAFQQINHQFLAYLQDGNRIYKPTSPNMLIYSQAKKLYDRVLRVLLEVEKQRQYSPLAANLAQLSMVRDQLKTIQQTLYTEQEGFLMQPFFFVQELGNQLPLQRVTYTQVVPAMVGARQEVQAWLYSQMYQSVSEMLQSTNSRPNIFTQCIPQDLGTRFEDKKMQWDEKLQNFMVMQGREFLRQVRLPLDQKQKNLQQQQACKVFNQLTLQERDIIDLTLDENSAIHPDDNIVANKLENIVGGVTSTSGMPFTYILGEVEGIYLSLPCVTFFGNETDIAKGQEAIKELLSDNRLRESGHFKCLIQEEDNGNKLKRVKLEGGWENNIQNTYTKSNASMLVEAEVSNNDEIKQLEQACIVDQNLDDETKKLDQVCIVEQNLDQANNVEPTLDTNEEGCPQGYSSENSLNLRIDESNSQEEQIVMDQVKSNEEKLKNSTPSKIKSDMVKNVQWNLRPRNFKRSNKNHTIVKPLAKLRMKKICMAREIQEGQDQDFLVREAAFGSIDLEVTEQERFLEESALQLKKLAEEKQLNSKRRFLERDEDQRPQRQAAGQASLRCQKLLSQKDYLEEIKYSQSAPVKVFSKEIFKMCRQFEDNVFILGTNVVKHYLQQACEYYPGSSTLSENGSLRRLLQFGVTFKVLICEMGNKGYGVVAIEDIPAGEYIMEYSGEFISLDEAIHRELKALQENGPKSQFHSYQWEIDFGERLVAVGTTMWGRCQPVIDAEVVGNVARYVNHSCNPNLASVMLKSRRGPPRVLFCTSKFIPKGCELTIDYDPAKNAINNPHKYQLKDCLCGELNCKGKMI